MQLLLNATVNLDVPCDASEETVTKPRGKKWLHWTFTCLNCSNCLVHSLPFLLIVTASQAGKHVQVSVTSHSQHKWLLQQLVTCALFSDSHANVFLTGQLWSKRTLSDNCHWQLLTMYSLLPSNWYYVFNIHFAITAIKLSPMVGNLGCSLPFTGASQQIKLVCM